MRKTPMKPRKAPLRARSRVPIPRKARTPKLKPKVHGWKVRRKRNQSETMRIYGPKAFRDWLHRQPCCVSGVRGDIEAVHVANGGMSRKADWTLTVPMARELHWRLHLNGVKTFEAIYGVSLLTLASETQNRWQAYSHSRKNA